MGEMCWLDGRADSPFSYVQDPPEVLEADGIFAPYARWPKGGRPLFVAPKGGGAAFAVVGCRVRWLLVAITQCPQAVDRFPLPDAVETDGSTFTYTRRPNAADQISLPTDRPPEDPVANYIERTFVQRCEAHSGSCGADISRQPHIVARLGNADRLVSPASSHRGRASADAQVSHGTR